MPRILFSLLLFTVVACSGTSKTSTPTPTPTPTPTTPTTQTGAGMIPGGDLNFGSVPIGTSRDGVLTVNNPGTATLEIAGMSLSIDNPIPMAVQSCMAMLVPLNPTTSIAVAPGETLTVGFRFTPTINVNCSGRLVIGANATFGSSSIRVTAIGV